MKKLKSSLTISCLFLLLAGLIAPGCHKSSTEPELKPNPTENLLPGVSYMGHGYNVFGDYAKSEYVKSPLLKYDSYQSVTVSGKSYNIPADMEYTTVNTADFRSVYGLNSYEFRDQMTINANLSGSYSFFSGSVTDIFNEEHYRSKYRAFCTVQNVIRKWKLTLPYTDLTKLRSMLTDEARNDIANLAPETLFNKYGTHLITELLIGARADYNTSIEKSQATSSIKNNFQVCAEASFKKGTGSGSYNMVTAQELQTFESLASTITKVSGGRSEYGLYIFQTGNYEKWIESIDNIEDLTIADFTENSLIPIWELCADDTRKAELSSAFDSYAHQFDLPPLTDEAIDSIYFEVTYNPPVTPKPGFTLIDKDLNRNAGGAYIYLCYRKGLDDQASISDVTFIVQGQAVPTGYTKDPTNLNEGTAGNAIYLCYKKEMTSNPIRRVDILIGQTAVPDPGFYFAKNYYWGAKQDLNWDCGSSSNYIWMVYSLSLPDPWL